jgi:hypothetical protein
VGEEWRARGHADTTAATLLTDLRSGTGLDAARDQQALAAAGELPPWFGDRVFHLSHQSALVRKDPAHYRPFFPDVADDLPYVWPPSDRERRVPVRARA